MLEEYIFQGAKKLRCGYTTGSCAAGAAKAAAEMLLTGRTVEHADIFTPKGVRLRLSVTAQSISRGVASCAVIKDSGDDPDVTNGIEIYAAVSLTDSGVEILGGEGVGRVTKAGLDQPVGEAAINSVPRKMIAQALGEIAELYEYSGGFSAVISVPKGKEIARRTFNPRVGIVGGISIIGTTGIVEPMSNSAIVETIRTEANIRRAEGQKTLILTIGNYSEKHISDSLPHLHERCVTCSNFIGEAIDIGTSLGFENILIYGHIGKLVKLGAGIMNTHSSVADGRIETLTACAAIAGVQRDILVKMSECVMTDAALDILCECGAAEQTLAVLSERIDSYLKARAGETARIGAVIFSFRNDMMIKTSCADEIIKSASEE